MIPRWHILYGFIFTILIWIIAPSISLINLSLIFLSSFLIDFDHYICSFIKSGHISLRKSFDYHKKKGIEQQNEKKKGIRRKGDFHLFHTIEFHLLVALLGIFFTPFLYIFIGMTFHSLLDVYDLRKKDFMYRREYFLTNWLRKNF
jgi:hypothetical protein